MIEFKLPDIGEGIAEGEIVKWLVEEGASVEEHEPVVEVMTDKATVEVPAPAAGKLTKRLAKEGDTVPVGTVIFHLDDGGSGAAKAQGSGGPERASAQAPEPSGGGNGSSKRADERPTKGAGGGGGGRTIEFKLPDIGEGIAEGEIVKWLVEEGADVEEHEPVVEVMTDKATVEVPAPAAGKLTKRLAKEGDTVPVGTVIFHLASGGGEGSQGEAEAPRAAEPTREAKAPEPRQEPARRPVERSEPARSSSAASSGGGDGKVLAVPSARRLARELGVDLVDVQGSGRGGVIRRKDVEAFSRSAPAGEAPARAAAERAPAPAPARAPRPAGEEWRQPFRGVRRKIADAMVRSASTAVHFTVVEEIDVTDLVRLRETAKAIGAESDVKVTYMPFIMKACAVGLAKFPTLNGHLDEDAQEIVHPGYVNLGIATDTPNGLIVPVVNDVQGKGLLELATDLQDLAGRTRAGKIKPEELRGSTFTITNAGNIGGTLATPIINFPDIAILGVHRIVKRPGVVETPEGDRIEVRQYMNLSLSVDHRLADGADGARFLAYLRRLLESPGLLAL